LVAQPSGNAIDEISESNEKVEAKSLMSITISIADLRNSVPVASYDPFEVLSQTPAMICVAFSHEPFDTGKAVGFAAIWIGLLLFIGDSVWRTRRAEPRTQPEP
jgi:hypothetical protein